MKKPIYHLASPDDNEQLERTGTYRAPTLETEGFIHCCAADQLPGVIQRYYIEATKLVLLHINAELLTAELVYENTSGGTEVFPHIYGQINAAAVVDTIVLEQSDITRIAASEAYQP